MPSSRRTVEPIGLRKSGRVVCFARSLDFPQINIDLIAGMLGESDENWHACVQKTIEMAPDSVTIYQMELPFNTTISRNLLKGNEPVARGSRGSGSVANWSTKRRWVAEAFAALEAAGYHVGSAYTAVKNPSTKFIYRDRLWQGADMVGLGVASFATSTACTCRTSTPTRAYTASIEAGGAAARPGPAPDPRREVRPGSSCCS